MDGKRTGVAALSCLEEEWEVEKKSDCHLFLKLKGQKTNCALHTEMKDKFLVLSRVDLFPLVNSLGL